MPRPSVLADAVHAAVIGLAVAASVAAGGFLMLRVAAQQSLPTLTEATTTAADSVGRAVADQVGRALGYGIPLDRLYAVDRFFGSIVAGSPIVVAIALRDPSGRIVFETAPGIDGASFPVLVDGTPVASLVLATAPPLVGPVIDRLRVSLAATALLFGLMAGVVAHLMITGHFGAGRRRLLDIMGGVLDDRYPAAPTAQGRGVVAAAMRACARCLDALRRQAHTLNDAIATVRAIDFDGSLVRRLEPIVAPVAAVIAPGADAARVQPGVGRMSGPWIAVVTLGLYGVVMPLVANFAIDRDWTYVARDWWPVLPVLAEAGAAVIGFAVVRRLLPGGNPLVAAVGLLLAGSATAAVAWTRDYVSFLELRALAAVGIGAALAALAGASAARQRQGLLGPVLFAALLAGPLLGGLIGEAAGRRLTFLVAGCLMLVLVPILLAMVRPAQRGEGPVDREMRLGRLLPAIAAGAAIGALLLVWVPMVPGYDNYLEGGLMCAAFGLAAVLSLRSLAAGLVLAAIGLAVPTLPGTGTIAVAAGLLLAGAGARALLASGPSRADLAVPALATGMALGAASVGGASVAALPATAPAAALVVVLAAIALALRARPMT